MRVALNIIAIIAVLSHFYVDGMLVIKEQHVSNCTEVDGVFSTVSAYYGWPFSLNCDALKLHWKQQFGVDFNSSNSQCHLKDLRTETYNSSDNLVLQPHMPALSFFQLYQTSGSQCLTSKVNVTLLPFPTSCLSAIDDALSCDKNVQQLSVMVDSTLRLRCIPASGSDAINPPSVPADQYKTEWLFSERLKNGAVNPDRSCFKMTDIKNDLAFFVEPDPGHPKKFQKTGVNYYDPGIYTCAVTYQNLTAYIAHYSVCVREELHENFQPTLLCEGEMEFFAGAEVTVMCEARKNRDKLQSGDLEIIWTKEGSDKVLCENRDLNNMMNNGENECKVKCGVDNFVNEESFCYPYIPEESELDVDTEERTFQVFLKFRDIQKSDAGVYTAQLIYKGAPGKPVKVELKFNRLRELRRIVSILVAVLVVVVVITILACLARRYRTLIKLTYRRHFGKYDQDELGYVATLAYYTPGPERVTAREETARIVRSIKNKMNELNYKYYDPAEEYDQGFKVETLLKHLEQSHRMIIVVTEDFIQDAWARFVTQQGLINMRRNETKLIFVRVPHVGKAIRALAGQPNISDLQNAMKACRNIYWKNDTDSRFLTDIEYALPKLQRSSSSYSQSGNSYEQIGNSPMSTEKDETSSSAEQAV
uniref:Soluble interferon alpha/beta receptor OPG204 n=1 Tax=Phallusia mammillata TaxID=59560 RepID=A0A6F9DGZ0_9ASCI|nr:uncharacterized protein LOC100177822 [Phallusia mammillata]